MVKNFTFSAAAPHKLNNTAMGNGVLKLLIMLCGLLSAILLAAGLLFWARPRRGEPLYVQVEDDAENIEWLMLMLLRKTPERRLLIINKTEGENRRILRALSRRYHLESVTEAPHQAPLLVMQRGVTAQSLLRQYEGGGVRPLDK